MAHYLEMKVLTIDIGVHHLGLVLSELSDDFTHAEIKWFELVNITLFTHNKISKDDCKLYHTKTFADWITHCVQEWEIYFDQADKILIERQPPMGFVVLEQLLFYRFRDKSVLISPTSLHCHFGIRECDYEERKKQTVRIILETGLLDNHQEKFDALERQHDITDSVCMLIFWASKAHHQWQQDQYRDNFKGLGNETLDEFFDKFKHRR